MTARGELRHCSPMVRVSMDEEIEIWDEMELHHPWFEEPERNHLGTLLRVWAEITDKFCIERQGIHHANIRRWSIGEDFIEVCLSIDQFHFEIFLFILESNQSFVRRATERCDLHESSSVVLDRKRWSVVMLWSSPDLHLSILDFGSYLPLPSI